MRNRPRVVLARLLILFVTVSGLLGSSCRQKQRQPTTLRIWQTEVNPQAVAVLKDINAEFERTHPGVHVELESIAWGALSSKLTTALAAGSPPDVAHLEPFMVSSMQSKNLLEPIDDVISALNPDDIFPAVKDLQMFNGRRYGIAYGMGITYFAYRKDVADRKGLEVPQTWDEYNTFIKSMGSDAGTTANVLLPGGDPFFIDQLTVELLSANGGRLFDQNNRPLFTDSHFIEVLRFYKALAQSAPSDWLNETYIDQFRHFATGRGLNVPVTYARAANQIDVDAPKGTNDPNHFAVMPQPVGPSGSTSYATLDAEPWVIFQASTSKELAKDYLKLFYRHDLYQRFCLTVPMHLTPIFRSLAESPNYLNNPIIRKWQPWQDQEMQFIREKRVRPIFITEDADLQRPFLLELQGSRILSDLVFAVAKDGQDPDVAAKTAQTKAEDLIERLGYRRW
jgi:multiple sugar transport system substrate-binding protein